ncbi:unnamed protein product [Pleuronectes platessa]|uniref:Uncharacterized protein n=1 Tax=Pleuronectes platessa TaxID=8262 RepID=A0A9N7VPK7_PLEPL|nr:unnamed protein product [Pleuronectes platessa]
MSLRSLSAAALCPCCPDPNPNPNPPNPKANPNPNPNPNPQRCRLVLGATSRVPAAVSPSSEMIHTYTETWACEAGVQRESGGPTLRSNSNTASGFSLEHKVAPLLFYKQTIFSSSVPVVERRPHSDCGSCSSAASTLSRTDRSAADDRPPLLRLLEFWEITRRAQE